METNRLTDLPNEESMLAASRYDSLTGLPNMSCFFELAASGREKIINAGERPALIYLDLSGMKNYNIRFGFTEGNRLLQAFAKYMTEAFRDSVCSHFGGDHFVILTCKKGLEDKLHRLFLDFSKFNDGSAVPVHAGVYLVTRESIHVSTACDRAKIACDALRGTYSSAINYYDYKLQEEAEWQQYILSNLDKAVSERWIRVYYQPIVRAVNGRVCEEEALARWIDPVRGFLSPDKFVPILEEAGVIYKLDLCMLEQVLEKLHSQEAAGLFIVPQSINLSRSDFDACDIVEEIRRRVDAAGISRDKITIEITESIIGSDHEFMKTQVDRFRELGFPVWMDDFGNGYSSLDVLQSIKFNLLKFDMSFMKRLNDGNSDGKIILTELMKMATALGIDTVCEGVETKEQVQFLREIGCSKLQGYYFARPMPMEAIFERYEKGIQIGFENPETSEYYETIGRVNLYDMAVVASEDEIDFRNIFNTLPMGIMEVESDRISFVRTNQSCREFLHRVFGFGLSEENPSFTSVSYAAAASFIKLVNQCCLDGNRAFFDETLPDGSIIHTFVRRISRNPVSGNYAAVLAVLSVSDEPEGTTYESIARALAADYYDLYYVDLETGEFIEYSSPIGEEELAVERHGKDFFEAARLATMTRIYEEDREAFLSGFTKDNILMELDTQGVFTLTYRLVDSGTPMYVNMKIMYMPSDLNHLIIGVSIIDNQMKLREAEERLQLERTVYGRIAALSGAYLSLYTVDPKTDRYIEFSATSDFESLGLAKTGEDFFRQTVENGKKTVYPDDLEKFLRVFTKDNVMRTIREKGRFTTSHRLVIYGRDVPVKVKAAMVQENDGEKLIVGISLE